MNVLEKVEKALEYLKNTESSARSHELQAVASTLGRCLGVLGSRQNYARHYANLLHSAIPALLSLASNDSAEIRLVGDEALNRAVVGGFSFHAYKINVLLQNQIDSSRNARWIRAALNRICLGHNWLRPGVGKIRTQAQTLFPKLSEIVRLTTDIQLTVEALENNLPRILDSLAEYTTDEEISELSKALLNHVESTDPAVRHGISICIAHLCRHREPLLTNLLSSVFEKLWPLSTNNGVVMGWFSVIKAIFQVNSITKFSENELFTVQDYLELYHLCITYIEQPHVGHNIQNTVIECLTVLLSHANSEYKKALLDRHPRLVCLENRQFEKRHRRNISSTSIKSTKITVAPTSIPFETREGPDFSFTGGLRLGSVSQLGTPSLSVEDLTIVTPDSAESDNESISPERDQLSKDLSEKLQEIEETEHKEIDQVDFLLNDARPKVNIGLSNDNDIPLKYGARLLASKFLLTGNKGDCVSDRSVRVSVKASVLNCMSEILQLYPQAMSMYLDKDADVKSQNISGSSEVTDLNQDNINDFILERNVCYQESLTDSLSQDLLNRSMDSHQMTNSHQIIKKDSRSLEKSMESVEQKSSLKDVQSNILDSRGFAKNELEKSAMSADSTNPNMTNSNFTTNSNMTGSNDPMSTGYPMTSSGDVLSSSIDLDIKFDHFGESTTNLDNLDALKDIDKREVNKRPLKRTDEVHSRDAPDGLIDKVMRSDDGFDKMDVEKDFEFQHMSDIFFLLEDHHDPQLRGLVRVCIGRYLSAALDLSHGDYSRWRNFSHLPKEVSDKMNTEKLVEIVLKGLSDDIHSAVNHTISALTQICISICNSVHWCLIEAILNNLVLVERNSYWLCRVNLCKLYEKIPYQKLFTLYPGYHCRSKLIMDTLFRLLSDQDQKVRHAAAEAIARIIADIYPSKSLSPISMVAKLAKNQSDYVIFNKNGLCLDIVRNLYFYQDLPEQLKIDGSKSSNGCLKLVIGDLFGEILSSSCKYYWQGLLEALHTIVKEWPPWNHIDAYTEQGILRYCIENIDYCNASVPVRTILMDLCTSLYPVEIHNVMDEKKRKHETFERDCQSGKDKWHYLESEKTADLAEKFLQVTLKMLNMLVHLIEEVNPNVHLNKSGIALPGSPVRRKTQDSANRRGSTTSESGEDKTNLRRKQQTSVNSLKANFVGHFFNEPFYMKLYENLRSTYSNHKINLCPHTSIFHEFLTTVLNALSIQLELATEKEFGSVTEELLYYLKVIMPLKPDTTVFCVTQLLKCLFGTNMICQYQDFMSISNPISMQNNRPCFFEDVMMVNSLDPIDDDRGSSVTSNSSQKLSLDSKNPRMVSERHLLITMENFSKNKMDRKWSTNKKELEMYIRLFEPVVIQALKSYTMQNDIPLQCKVLSLLNQLLTLRVNYCMLDSDQIFIGFLMKQLDLVEQHEIPNCCELVNGILTFLVHLSSSKHHTKQIIEIPKLIQLCDGLMASGATLECIAGLEPVAVRVFSNMGGGSVLGRTQQQEAQATREVLFYMLQKTMHQHKVLDIVSCVLCLSQEHSESYYRWSELASDTLLNLLTQRSVEIDTFDAISSLERLIDSIYKDVLLEQSRVEILLKILFKAPPYQTTTPYKLKLRYLSIIMILLRKVLVLIPESEILLSINYLKAWYISPQSIFFNVRADVDPLNVQNVNENCVNLSPDVILVRFLFKTLTYAILEVDNCHEVDCANFDSKDLCDKSEQNDHSLLFSVCVNIVIQVKHMLHLTDGCLFPLTSKTAQSILHNEQSGLNTGLYSPEENIPLDLLNLICLRCAQRMPLLTMHWSHLLIRLNFLSHKYWQKLVGFARHLPLGTYSSDSTLLCTSPLQVACFMAYCEYFIENGLSEVVHLTWLLVNRVHILISQYHEPIVQKLVGKVQETAVASGLLLQAVAARCQGYLKGEFALSTYKILSLCHESQSGALIFLICRIMGKLEPAIAVRFSKLAIDRCIKLKDMPIDNINIQLSKEDVQVALELLQRDKLHVRYSSLVMELNSLASTVFDLSPLDLSQDRAINPNYIVTTSVDGNWLLNQVKNRCCQTHCTTPKVANQKELALLLSQLSKADLPTVMSCPEFDRKLLGSCFVLACDNFIKDFLNIITVQETREAEKERMEFVETTKLKDELVSSVDSNKLNIVNTLHVFKKSDKKETKSQFFIPISEDSVRENFGNLKLSYEESEIVLPELSDLYVSSLTAFDKSLTDIIRLFPKQNRPLSQSENFNLNIEQTVDRYTRRCHQVFQDKLFYQEFITLHTVLKGFLQSIDRIIRMIDQTDCDLLEKSIENILPLTLAKNIAIFSVISLQYLSFLIKNKKIVESPIHADVSFRATQNVSENIIVDNVIVLSLENVAEALSFLEIWTELNVDGNPNRTQSAVSCLYAIVKYLVKEFDMLARLAGELACAVAVIMFPQITLLPILWHDLLVASYDTYERRWNTRPLIMKHYVSAQDPHPKSEFVIVANKLVTLIDYWEQNFYCDNVNDFLSECYRNPIESLIVSLSRLDVVSNIALVPPLAWPSIEVVSKKEQVQKVDLPLHALQDLDVLEGFLFRVNLVGWSSKKQFEEIWMGLLGALQGNGVHWAVRGITQLLISAAPTVRRSGIAHVPRSTQHLSCGMQRLRSILVGTSTYNRLFDTANLERIPLMNDRFDGYHYAQFSTEYLKLASDITEDASYKVRREVRRLKKNADIDLNSCLQFLMDVTTQMLEPKAPTGLAARVALLSCIIHASEIFTETGQWCWAAHTLIALTGPAHASLTQYSTAGRALLYALAKCLSVLEGFEGLHELSTVHQKLLKSLSSSYAPLRQAALQGCLLQLSGRAQANIAQQPSTYQELLQQLNVCVTQYTNNDKISLYEQSLYWTVLFTLVELGHPELTNVAVDFVLANPRHYCTDLVVKGITSTISQHMLSKELKNIIIEKLLDNMKVYSERHAIQILMVHFFSADNKLLSPKLASDVSNMDPDVLMNSMERITLIYKTLRRTELQESKLIITNTLKYFLRETLPPAATLSRVVIEFIECCKQTEKTGRGLLSDKDRWILCSCLNAQVVFEVFQTAVSQDQLPVLSGWIFEALCHLLSGKVSTDLLPYCVLLLLVSASSNQFVRKIYPLCYHILKLGFYKCSDVDEEWGVFGDFVTHGKRVMSFSDRRLLCVVAKHSNFSGTQLERLRELCDENACLEDLLQCLNV